jgi:hypothetical protein
VQDQPASTDAPAQAASEPADLKPKTQARFDRVLAERAHERDRADRAEAHIRQLEARHRQPPVDVRPAASSPAPAGLVKPNPDAFPYGTADPDYLEALTDFKVGVTLANERAARDQAEQQARMRDESQRVMTAFEAKTAAAREAHPDFDAVAMMAPTEIQPGTAAELWVLEDEAGAEILYHLQQPTNAAERRRILALGPREQLKELVRLGDRLTTPAGAARSTNAPPPPPHLATRATPGDLITSAVRTGDYGAYKREADARELAARRKQ